MEDNLTTAVDVILKYINTYGMTKFDRCEIENILISLENDGILSIIEVSE